MLIDNILVLKNTLIKFIFGLYIKFKQTKYHCSVDKLCLTLCDPLQCSLLGFSVPHYLPEFAQAHAH